MFVANSVEEYEEFATSVELTLQQLVQAHNYNTVGNLLRFYEEFRTSGVKDVSCFYRQYNPPITPEHHTCVGLSLELLKRLHSLIKKFPGVAGKFYLVSCEEAIDDLPGYIRADPSAATSEKEHVIVCLQLLIAGRPGVLLLDPGYHVARVVTVMTDNKYPHTGWFTQSDEKHVRKEYNYSFAENTDYIQWLDRETRESGMRVETSESVIYIAKPYLTPVQVTERRNLVYNFRSLLARDTKGQLIAGIYFPVKENSACTVFYTEGADKKRARFNVTDIARSKEVIDGIQITGAQLSLPPGELDLILEQTSLLIKDKEFLRQILDINREINLISLEN